MNKRELYSTYRRAHRIQEKDVHTTLQATIDCISEVILRGDG